MSVCVLSADRFDDGDALPHTALHSGVHDAAGLAVCLHRFGGPLRDDGGAAVLMEKVKSFVYFYFAVVFVVCLC